MFKSILNVHFACVGRFIDPFFPEVRVNFIQRQKPLSGSTIFNKCCLQAGLDFGNDAFIDVSLGEGLLTGFDIQFVKIFIDNNSNTAFFIMRGIDEHYFFHGTIPCAVRGLRPTVHVRQKQATHAGNIDVTCRYSTIVMSISTKNRQTVRFIKGMLNALTLVIYIVMHRKFSLGIDSSCLLTYENPASILNNL